MNLRRIVAAAVAGITAAGVVWALASRPDGRLHVTVLSTGSSTAVLVRTSDGSTALVDGGGSPALLLAALGRVLSPATSRLDVVVLTGGEQAAVNGLNALPGHYSVGTVMSPGGLTSGGNAIIATLADAGANVVDTAGAAWSFGGATWRCLGFISLVTARAMCALAVDDPTGRVLILGDAGTADQEGLCAVYESGVRADLVVTPPGGAISSALLATAQPSALAVPLAPGAPGVSAPRGYPTARTSADGDLEYIGGSGGLMKST